MVLIPGLSQWVKDLVWLWLWLWCRLAATSLIWPLSWEPPYAAGAALKRPKKKKKKKRRTFRNLWALLIKVFPLVPMVIWSAPSGHTGHWEACAFGNSIFNTKLFPAAYRLDRILHGTHMLYPCPITNRLKPPPTSSQRVSLWYYTRKFHIMEETSKRNCPWTSLEVTLSGSVNSRYSSETPGSQSLGSHFTTKEVIKNSTQLENYWNRGPQTEDAQKSFRTAYF